jgi:hypothetical protein
MKRLAITLLLFGAVAIEAQAPSSFREGVIAFEKKEWAAAEKLMRQTVAGNPNESEGTVSISGSWFETYVPHYFLARALAKQGKCEEALREFAESERQGVTPGIEDFARHLRSRDGCRPQAKPEKPPRVIDVAEIPFGDPGPSTTTRAPKPEVTAPVVAKPPKQSTEVPPATAAPRPLRAAVATLTAVVSAYVGGDYEETIRRASTPFDLPAAAGEAALFRAAARYALYRIGGEKDDALRREIERDLGTYHQLRPNSRPDPRIFPPRFIAWATR